MLAGVGADELAVQGVVAATLAPFDAHKERYGELERRQLATEVAALDLALAGDADDTVRRMTGAVGVVGERLQLAVERCVAFTSGTEVSGCSQLAWVRVRVRARAKPKVEVSTLRLGLAHWEM